MNYGALLKKTEEFERTGALTPRIWGCLDLVRFRPRLKVLVSFLVGKHTIKDAEKFLGDVKERSDSNIPLSTSDELPLYPEVILKTFGKEVPQAYKGKGRRPTKKTWVPDPNLDYAQVVKTRKKGRIVSVETKVIFGDPKRIAQKIANSPVSNSINTSFACQEFFKSFSQEICFNSLLLDRGR